MAILKNHAHIYREIFKIPGIIAGPFLSIGYQEIAGKNLPQDFRFKDLKDLMSARGVNEFYALDFFDDRADIRRDLNFAIPESEYEKYNVVFDIGTLEHVFDSSQCLENCLRMVRKAGLYFLVTVVNGYYGHGLHVFNPELLTGVLAANNFEILHLKYSTERGKIIKGPQYGINVLAWIVSRKTASMECFLKPQQGIWYVAYKNDRLDMPASVKNRILIKRLAWGLIIILLRPLWRALNILADKIKRGFN